jgi:capsular polysaccharide biosynthesis protein
MIMRNDADLFPCKKDFAHTLLSILIVNIIVVIVEFIQRMFAILPVWNGSNVRESGIDLNLSDGLWEC